MERTLWLLGVDRPLRGHVERRGGGTTVGARRDTTAGTCGETRGDHRGGMERDHCRDTLRDAGGPPRGHVGTIRGQGGETTAGAET